MNQRFKIEFRKHQLYFNNDILQPVTINCLGNIAEYVPGTITPNPWVDMSAHTEGLDKLSFTWDAATSDYSSGSDKSTGNQFGSNYSKGLSIELGFISDAFEFIYAWLMTDNCQTLNAIDVKITDLECDKEYRTFEIKTDNVKYRPKDNPCFVSMPLREQDLVYHVFQKTIIEDNWQGWFNEDGTSTKDHPTFMYVVEKRPHFILSALIVIAYIAGMLSAGILIALDAGKRWIRRILGICYFCPSPLIRTYIENICAKYGYTFDTIFDEGQQYENACVFFPVENSAKNFEDYTAPDTHFYWGNRTGYAFSDFLDQLKKVYNAEWYITPNNQLIFKPRAYFDALPPLYDFSDPSAIQIFNLEYTFNGDKKPAYGNYQYRIDPQDTCSNDSKWRYNTIVDYDGLADNPMLEGNITKDFDFATTSFMYDGTTVDFIEESVEAGRLVAVGAVLVGLIQLLAAAGPLTAAITAAIATAGYFVTNNYVNDFFNRPELVGALRTSSNVINIPRLIMWDGENMDSAKAAYTTNPTANPVYNPDEESYYVRHPAFDAPGGYFGSTVDKIFNYELMVDEDFTGNLFDRFHEYDNPVRNTDSNQSWSGDVDLCCSMLDLFGVWKDDYVKIGAVVILEDRNGRIIKGRVRNIKVSYETGMIHLEGKVLL